MAKSVSYIIQLRDRYSPSMRKINASTYLLEKRIKRASKQIEHFTKLGKKMKSFGGAMTARVTAPILALGTASAFSFGKLEKGIGNVFGLMDDNEIAQFGDDIKKAQQEAIKMGFSMEDTNNALFNAVSALGAGEQSMKAFQTAQKLAIAGNADLGVAIDGITSIVNAYGREMADVNEVANTFFSGQVKGKTDVAKLSSTIGQVAPIAKAAGVGYKELIATVSTLTLGGLSTEESVTSLKGALNSLLNPAEQAEKVLRKLKIPVGATEIRSMGLTETLRRLSEATAKYPDIITKAIPNIKGLTAVTALSEDKLKIMDETLIKINQDILKGTGLNDKYAKKMAELNIVMGQAKGSITILFQQIGQVLAPVLIRGAKLVKKLADKFTNLSPGMKKIIVITAAIVAGIGPLIAILGTLVIGMAAVKIAAAVLGITLTAAFGAFIIIPALVGAAIAFLIRFRKAIFNLKNMATVAAAALAGLLMIFFPIPGIIAGVISAITLLAAKLNVFKRAREAVQKMKEFFGGDTNVEVDNTGELKTVTSQTVTNQQQVDISGQIGVKAAPGTEITQATFNAPLGVNVAMAGAR